MSKKRNVPTSTAWPANLPSNSDYVDVIPNPSKVVDPRDYGRSKRQQQLYQADLAAWQWESQLAYQEYLRQHEEEYNSPEQQVLRMKEAGLNPDILGGVSSGEASEIASTPTSQPIDSIPRDGRVYNQIKAGFDTVLNSVIGGVQTIQSLQNVFQSSQRFDLEEALSIDNFAKHDAFNLGFETPPERFMSSRLQKRYINAYRDNMVSRETMRDAAKYQEELNKTLSSGYFNLNPAQIEDIGKLAADWKALEAIFLGLQQENAVRYEQKSSDLGLPELKASAEYSKQSFDKSKSDLQDAAYKKLEEIVSTAEEKAEDNPAISFFVATAMSIPAIRFVLNKIPGGKKLFSRFINVATKTKGKKFRK